MKRPQTISYVKKYVSKVYIQDQHNKEIKFEEHHSIPFFLVVFQFSNGKLQLLSGAVSC